MINAEKLLGKVVQEVMGSSSHGVKKKKKKKKGGSSLASSFKSGAGLMTVIGLGIGAYEILKDKNKPPHTGGHYPGAPPSPATPPGQVAPPPPPPPPTSPAARPGPPVPATPAETEKSEKTEKLAVRFLQAMIAAAHADGTMDSTEEEAVIGRLRDEEFSQEEKMFLLSELHNPKTIEELTEGIDDPSIAKMMYMLAVGTIEIDTPEEREWLDALAARLQLSKTIQEFIEDQV